YSQYQSTDVTEQEAPETDADQQAEVTAADAGTSDIAETEPSGPQDVGVDVATISEAAGQEAVLADAAQARQQARLAADLERQKLNSLREVANLSARSALARHASTELKNALLAEGLVTGLCVTGT